MPFYSLPPPSTTISPHVPILPRLRPRHQDQLPPALLQELSETDDPAVLAQALDPETVPVQSTAAATTVSTDDEDENDDQEKNVRFDLPPLVDTD